MGSEALSKTSTLQSFRSILAGMSSIGDYLSLSPPEKVRTKDWFSLSALQLQKVKTDMHSTTAYDQYRAEEAESLEFNSLIANLPKLHHLDLGLWRYDTMFPSAVFEYEAFPSVHRLTLRRWADFGGSKSIYNQIDHTALEHLTLDQGYVTA